MKNFAILGVLIFLSGGLLAQESAPLWPEGKTPFSLLIDKKTGSPSLKLYPGKGSEGHTGAAVVICSAGG